MKEFWKKIESFEMYEVSNFGKIRRNKKILKNNIDSNGYLSVCLSKKSVVTRFRIHRLVALHFLSNKNKLPVVNHKDGNKKNNCANNLEWCTQSYNLKHRYRVLKNKPNTPYLNKFGKEHNRSKSFIIKDADGNINKYYSGLEFKRETGFDQTAINYAKKNYTLPWTFKKGNLKGYTLIEFNDN